METKKQKYEEMSELEKQVYNIKEEHKRILHELGMIRRIKEKKLNLSFEEQMALQRYEHNLKEEYGRSLRIAREFEDEFKVLGLGNEIATMSLEENLEPDLTEMENLFLTKAIELLRKDNEFENSVANARNVRNEELLNDMGVGKHK